ncbi:MAG: ABC transporter ATP-binding protein [Acidimicrobiia bacterium]|nr:ABC transporter ATP-binding protein [Acidimicrobiia bacterium]
MSASAVAAPSFSLFELGGVSRVYGEEVEVWALRQVALDIRAGDFMAIIGPSGSGKSTLLGLLGCLDLPSAGSIKVAGREVTDLDDAERSKIRGDAIGFVFQQFHLIPHLTALGNVSTALLYRNLSKSDRREIAMNALELVGLAERHDHRPVQLSGGEQQRVAIARAIVTDPKMVLADEPTGALDTKNASMVLEIFEQLRSDSRAIVVVTHDLQIAERMDRVVSMRDGEIIADEHRHERSSALADRFWEAGRGTTLE